MKKVRDEMGLTNVKLMVPFCRTVEEGAPRPRRDGGEHGLSRGESGLEVYVMCEIPSNVILAEQFAEVFDGFSIGSNDLTQLILGVDRDSEIVAHRLRRAQPGRDDDDRRRDRHGASAAGRKIGICGQAPSDYPEFARFLVEQGIDSISLEPRCRREDQRSGRSPPPNAAVKSSNRPAGSRTRTACVEGATRADVAANLARFLVGAGTSRAEGQVRCRRVNSVTHSRPHCSLSSGRPSGGRRYRRAAVLVGTYAHHPAAKVHDDALEAVQAKSACEGSATTLGTLHAMARGRRAAGRPVGSRTGYRRCDARARRRAVREELRDLPWRAWRWNRPDGGPQLEHPPANFTIGTYELRTTEHEALPADIDMFRTITRGVHGTAMPPWFALPERDRWALVAHLKTLSKQFQEDEAPPPIDIQPPEVTPERIARGRQMYDTGGCASCHGADAHGDGPAAGSLTYKSGVPAHPRDLMLGRFHRSTRLGDIYLTLVTGLDGTPMASFAKVLSPDELWDVAMYVHSLTPSVAEGAGGLRCPRNIPADPTFNPDELVGVRTVLRSLHLTH